MELEAPRFDYDVFLSFRGSDTRQGFASVLHDHMVRAGIRVFKDDGELKAGDKIETVLEAINNSELCVPIFSKNFASSKWCLEEARRMVRLEKVICPVFYGVSVEDVKLKTQTYNKLMQKLETNKEENVDEWKDALKAATEFKGQILGNQSYTDFCKEFIRQLPIKLGGREQFVVNDLIGLENQLDRFTKLLDVNSADVRYIGIHGMGGVGKTTLAKFIFDKFSASFDCCSFIENIRETSSTVNGLSNLEKEHIANLDRTCKKEFDSFRGLNQRFYRKKVLVILDDVDKSEQIEKLVGKSSSCGPGSRIVVTTRDVRVLTKCGKLKAEEVFPFEMETLESHHALQLFSSHAFTKNSPPPDFLNLSKEVVSTAGGLPLALVVLGSLLRNEDNKGVWKDIIKRSKKVPIDKVKNRLKISYDKLADDQKQIFLDIACLSVCTEKSKVINMWEASEFFPIYGLAVLQSMSLIKMKDNNEIWMHDMLRELGRDIVRRESVLPRKRSRLWEHDEALEVLKSKSKKENVQAISLDKSSEVTLRQEQLETLENLRFLELGEAKFEGDLDNVLPNLRWFSWRSRSRFEASNFCLPNLVSLDLSNSSITENWRGWSQLLQGAKNLKDLYLMGCSELSMTPEFPEHMILERLVLQDCDSLAAIHNSIGNLKCLKHLELVGTKIVRLPETIVDGLKKLENLLLSHTNLRELPNRLGNLKSLVNLDVQATSITKLPDSIGRLGKLERLALSHCSALKTLPPSIGNVRSLIELHLSRTAITELPDSIRSLENLKELRVDGCKLRNLPQWLTDLGKLEVLRAGSNGLLEELPEDIGGLVSLRMLDLKGSSISKLPSSISQLSLLKTLNLSSGQLQELPELPKSLSELSIASPSLKKVSDLSGMDNLVKLYILVERSEVETSNLNLIEKLINLELVSLLLQLQKSAPLPTDFSRLTQLKYLSLPCKNLKDPLQLPSSLSDLLLKHVDSETNLPCLSNLLNLSILTFVDWSRNSAYDILRIEDLHSLEVFTVMKCSCDLMDGLHLPQNLMTLNIWDCESLTKLPDLAGLKDLSFLELSGCESLTEIPGLGKSKFLISLRIEDCNSLERLENLSELEILEELMIINCEALDCIDGIDCKKLKTYYMGPWEDLLEDYYEDEAEDGYEDEDEDGSCEIEDDGDEDEDGSYEVEGGSHEVEGDTDEDADEWQNQRDEVEDEQPLEKIKKAEDEDEWLQLRLSRICV